MSFKGHTLALISECADGSVCTDMRSDLLKASRLITVTVDKIKHAGRVKDLYLRSMIIDQF